jgi:hypothetical protein
MPGKAAVVSDLDPAEHQRPRAGEGVDIETHPGAADEPPCKRGFGTIEIGRGGQFVEHWISSDRRHLQPGLDHHGRFVRRGAAAGFFIGVKQVLDMKGLRRLDAQ